MGTQPSPGLPETFTWSQFLIDDDEPLPVHTAMNRIFPAGRNAVERIIPLVQLRNLSSFHSEADECGAECLARGRSKAIPLCSLVAARTAISDDSLRSPCGLQDGERLSLGRFRFLEPVI